jgi:hypothetical protein
VIYATSRASVYGFDNEDPEWANMGQVRTCEYERNFILCGNQKCEMCSTVKIRKVLHLVVLAHFTAGSFFMIVIVLTFCV